MSVNVNMALLKGSCSTAHQRDGLNLRERMFSHVILGRLVANFRRWRTGLWIRRHGIASCAAAGTGPERHAPHYTKHRFDNGSSDARRRTRRARRVIFVDDRMRVITIRKLAWPQCRCWKSGFEVTILGARKCCGVPRSARKSMKPSARFA